MRIAEHISHYFERESGPFLNICDLDRKQRKEIIDREKDVETGFNRFSYGEEFFDFRLLADDLLLELYTTKFGKAPPRRPYYAVLGDSDVVGGLYRDPYKLRIPVEEFEVHELTFMCPDHFHLVGMNRPEMERLWGFQTPDDYSPEKYPYYGQLLSYEELAERLRELEIDTYLARQKKGNHWYRYVEAQIWADPGELRSRHGNWTEVDPEPWTHCNVTYLQNYKLLKRNKQGLSVDASITSAPTFEENGNTSE